MSDYIPIMNEGQRLQWRSSVGTVIEVPRDSIFDIETIERLQRWGLSDEQIRLLSEHLPHLAEDVGRVVWKLLGFLESLEDPKKDRVDRPDGDDR